MGGQQGVGDDGGVEGGEGTEEDTGEGHTLRLSSGARQCAARQLNTLDRRTTWWHRGGTHHWVAWPAVREKMRGRRWEEERQRHRHMVATQAQHGGVDMSENWDMDGVGFCETL